MAGSIFVSSETLLSLSSVQFDYLVEKIRAVALEVDKTYWSQIFEPMDEGGMSFISLEQQDISGFSVFCSAVTLAKEKSEAASAEGHYLALWNRLTTLLQQDSRYRE